MDKINIFSTDKSEFITMPRTKNIIIGAKEESRRAVMVSGKIVKDVLGYRIVVKAHWDYIPVGLVAQLATLIRQSSFVWVEYPSPTGLTFGWFEIEYPAMKVFTYKNGEAVWHNVTLEFIANEVTVNG